MVWEYTEKKLIASLTLYKVVQINSQYLCMLVKAAGHHSSGGEVTGENGPAIELRNWSS